MTDITPTPDWTPVRQIETTDRVLGGPLPDGVANLHAQALSNQNLYARKHGGTLPFLPGLTYDTGDRVKLASGDIVKSTTDGNTNNPNVDMTGWKKPQSSEIFDESGLSQQEINNLKAGKTYVDSQDLSLQSQINQKAETVYVDAAVGAISTDASKQYATLALAEADIANIALNKNVFISEAVNGGYWYKETAEATTLSKSPYDPSVQAKTYSDTKASISPSENILELRDLYEKLIVLMKANGDLYIPNLDKSIQAFLKMLEIEIEDVKLRLEYDESTTAITAVDKNGKLIFSITSSGALHIRDVVTQNGSVEKRLKSLEENSSSDTAVEILKSTDYAIATRDDEALLSNTMLFSLEELSVSYVFASSICRLSKREFLVFCEGRLGGDFDAAKLFMRKVTVNNDYSLTLGAVSIVADSGTVGAEPFSCINACSVKVETGAHAGRIYLYYIKRFYENDRDELYQIYSDDNGVTWSAPIDMSVFMPNFANWRVVAVGPGKAIQLKRGTHTGRIVLPCWHADLNYPSSTAGLKSFILYSDDGGVTYTVGAESEVAGSNECQVAETVSGDIALLIRDNSQYKLMSTSTDGGLTLHSTRVLTEITTTRVQSSICQFKNLFDLSVPKLVVCTPSVFGLREDLGLFVSYDEKTFALWKVITDGLSSYSDIMPIDESHILVTYSAGRVDANRDIKAVVVNLKSILLGA